MHISIVSYSMHVTQSWQRTEQQPSIMWIRQLYDPLTLWCWRRRCKIAEADILTSVRIPKITDTNDYEHGQEHALSTKASFVAFPMLCVSSRSIHIHAVTRYTPTYTYMYTLHVHQLSSWVAEHSIAIPHELVTNHNWNLNWETETLNWQMHWYLVPSYLVSYNCGSWRL